MAAKKNKELENLFKLLFATKINPDKYKDVKSYEELDSLLEQNLEDKQQVYQLLSSYTEDELQSMASEMYETTQMAKSGGKLNYLNKLKKYKKGARCKCGCELVFTKEKGGKVTQKCACGCKQ
jgi:hypothetical protein